MNTSTFLFTFLSLLVTAQSVEARLYKCTDNEGRVTYQQESCPATAVTSVEPNIDTTASGVLIYHGTEAPGDYIGTKQRRRAAPKKTRKPGSCYRVKTKHGTRCLTASERRRKARDLRWEMDGLKGKAVRGQQIYGRPGGIYMPEVKTRGENGRTLREMRRERDALLQGIHQGREGGYEK